MINYDKLHQPSFGQQTNYISTVHTDSILLQLSWLHLKLLAAVGVAMEGKHKITQSRT